MSYSNAFVKLRELAGNPTMTIIDPRSTWGDSVPVGYAFDADYDRYINVAGTIWTPTSANVPTSTIKILPSSGQLALDLEAGGLVPTGSRSVRILPADYAAVVAAEWCELDSQTYNAAELTPFPAGAALWYIVRLEKR